MIKNTYLLLFLTLTFATGLQAQMHKCGVTHSMGAMLQEQMLENRNEMRDFIQVRSGNVYLPIRFFMVAKSDGSDRTSEVVALKALCHLNNNYADQEIQFYIKEFKYLNNSQLFSNPGGSFAYSTLSSQTIYNAINIYIVDGAGSGVAAYYQPPAGPNGNDWIVAGEGEADDFEVLTHEVGHFFSLNHPFYGWESGGWNFADHGNPVGTHSPDGELNEYADGSNCEDAGDMICDTPADYLFPFPGPDGCTYTGNVMDPTGAPISPDMTNFMNYASCSNGLYHFTDDQKEEIQNSLNSSSRNYIPKDNTPNLNPVEDSPNLVSPGNLQTVETYNHVTLEWTAVDNADHYLLELNNAETGQQIFIIEDTKITLTNLIPESNYFWKIMGYTDYSTCEGFSSQRIFKTGSDTVSDTNEIPELSDWSLAPNPVRSGETLQLNIESDTGFKADIMISTITGQLVQTIREQQFANGITAYEIPTTDMPAGIYLVSLHTEDGVQTKRVSIL